MTGTGTTKTHRSDVPDRLARLRRLDIPLGSEFENGGAMTFDELHQRVATRNVLGVPVFDATLWEWWSYACHRRFALVDFVLGERAAARPDRRVLARNVAWLEDGPLPRLF